MTALQTPAPDAPAAEWGAFAVSIPGWQCRPDLIACLYRVDPDHWAWEGWLLRLIGPCEVGYDDADPECGPWSVEIPGVFRMGATLGRACIAAAAALGRWPGGEL